MNRNVQPQPAPAPDPAAPPSPGRRRAWLAVLALLLVGAGVGTALWLRGRGTAGTGTDGPGADRSSNTAQDQRPACSDEDDPKYLDPLEFGPPVRVPFERGSLDGLAEKPIAAVEVYPWQPEGLVAVLGEHRMRGPLFALHPEGKLLAVAAGDTLIRVGPTDTLHEKHILTSPANVVVLAWSPDGKTLAVSGADGEVRLLDVRDLEKIPAPVALAKPAAVITSLSWSADGKYLLGGDGTPKGGTATVWDIEARKIVSRLRHTGPVLAVAFSPVAGDYRALTAGGSEDGQLHLWNALDEKEEIKVIEFKPSKTDATVVVGVVAFSPDGKRALSCHPDGAVRLWDLDHFEKGKETHTLAGHAGLPTAAFAPDGRSVASGRFGDGGVYLWNAQDGKQARKLATPAGVYSLRFPPGGDRLVYAGTLGVDTNIHVHEVETGKELLPPVGHLAAATSVSLGPGGGVVASGGADQALRVWDLGTVRQRHAVGAGAITTVGFHPDGRRAWYTSGSYATLSFLDVETGQGRTPAYSHQHSGAVASAAITADGRYAVTGGASDGTVRMWRLEDGRQVRSLDMPPGEITARVSVAPDMRRAIRVGGSQTRLVQLRCLQVKHEWAPAAWAPFLPDGRAVLFGGKKAPAYKVSLDKVEPAGEFNIDLTGMAQGDLSADGKRVAAAIGGRAACFDLESGRQLWTWTPPPYFGGGGVYGVTLSADGGHLLTANGDGTVYVVKLP
jgi:WD40 repeat protein